MATLDNVWAMYMGLKDRRRQAERDQVADDKYADQLQQQSLGNIRADEQLRLNQDAATRAKEAVTLEQTRWDGLAGKRANEATLQEQNIAQGKQTIASGALKATTDRLKVTAPQAQKLVFSARKNGALQALNDPTQMPIVENLIAEVLEVNNFLPEGTRFAGFEEIAGPGRDGKSTKVFVPMMEDANGQKTDIGQMLGGEGADAFTAEQIIDFIEAAGQANLGVNTSMALESVAKAPEANAGKPLTPNLGTNTQGTGTQQTSPVVDPTVDPTVDPAVDPAVRFGNNRADPNAVEQEPTDRIAQLIADTEARYAEQREALGGKKMDAKKRLAMTEQLEDVLLDDVMSATGLNIDEASKLIRQYRSGDQGEFLTAKQAGANTVKAAGMISEPLGTVADVLSYLPKKIIDGAKDFAEGAGEELNNSGDDTVEQPKQYERKTTASASLNDKTLSKQEQVIIDKPPTAQEQAQVQSNNIASVIQQQKGGKKRPTQAQRDDRALDLAIRTANGETFTAKQKESYLNTGFLEGTKVSNVTIGYNDYEQHIDQYGVVSYKQLGLSGAAITAINKADVALNEAQIKKTEAWWKKAAPYALSAAGVTVTDGDKGTGKANIGAYMNQKDFHLTAQHFMNLHVSSLAPILGFDPRNGPQDRGQERLLTGVMTAYAKAVQASKSGDVNYSNANSFSAFLKAHSAESGSYLIGNRLINVENEIDKKVEAQIAQGQQPTGDDIAQLRAELITEFKKAQGI